MMKRTPILSIALALVEPMAAAALHSFPLTKNYASVRQLNGLHRRNQLHHSNRLTEDSWHSRAAPGIPSRRTFSGSTSSRPSYSRGMMMMAKPKRGSVVDGYRAVSVNCAKCGERLFRYRKKNGTKSNLVKCYVERICEDSAGILEARKAEEEEDNEWICPNCKSRFGRSSLIHGLPAIKLVGGKVRMTKK